MNDQLGKLRAMIGLKMSADEPGEGLVSASTTEPRRERVSTAAMTAPPGVAQSIDRDHQYKNTCCMAILGDVCCPTLGLAGRSSCRQKVRVDLVPGMPLLVFRFGL